MKRALPYLLFGAVTLAAFAEFLFLGRTLYDVRTLESRLDGPPPKENPVFFERPPFDRGDTVLLLPQVLGQYNEGLKAGELRLWNPRLFCGYPLYSDPMAHAFYPPHLALHGLLPTAAAYEMTLLLHLFFAGTAMYWLLLAFGRSRAAASAGGLIWMLFGYHALWFSTEVLAGVSVFLPLALLALVRAREEKDFFRAGLAGVALGMIILGSHPQHALHAFLLLLVWLVASLWSDRENRTFLLRMSGIFVGVGLGIGLPSIVSRLDSIENGYRWSAGDFPNVYSNPHLWTHLVGVAIGKAYFPATHLERSEFIAYAGFAGTLLAVAGAVRDFRVPIVRFAALFGAVVLFVVYAPPMAAVLHSIPGFDLSLPSRMIVLVGFCIPILAAHGTDALAQKAGRFPVVAAGASAAFFVLWLVFAFPVLPALETLIGMALAVGAAFALRRSPRAAWGLCLAALLFDLLPTFLIYNDHRDGDRLETTPPALAERIESADEPWRAGVAVGMGDEAHVPRFLWPLSIQNNFMALYGVETAAGYEAIAPIPAVQFCVEAGGRVGGSGRVVTLGDPTSPLLGVAGINVVLVPSGLKAPAHFEPGGEWGAFRLYENRHALPRAYVASRAIAAETPEDAGRLLRSDGFVPGSTVVIETESILPTSPATDSKGTVAWIKRSSDHLELDVETDADGYLVVSDTWYPGWEADVDGNAAEIHRANVAFRAVAVPAGTHRVTFRFRPVAVRQGFLGWLLAAIALAGLAWARRLRKSEIAR